MICQGKPRREAVFLLSNVPWLMRTPEPVACCGKFEWCTLLPEWYSLSSIVAIPIVILASHIHTALWLSALVWAEVFILAANRLRCPLTGLPEATQAINPTT